MHETVYDPPHRALLQRRLNVGGVRHGVRVHLRPTTHPNYKGGWYEAV